MFLKELIGFIIIFSYFVFLLPFDHGVVAVSCHDSLFGVLLFYGHYILKNDLLIESLGVELKPIVLLYEFVLN